MAHRAFRHLADRLAAQGLDTLRFDYRGTGDSYGAAAEASVAGWLDDIGSAIEELQSITGCRRIGLVGLRLGASLAAEAAVQRREVDRVVLWKPVTSGPSYLSELAERQSNVPRPGRVRLAWRRRGSRDLLGYPLTRELEAELAGIEIGRLTVPPRVRALYVSTEEREDPQATRELAGAFSELDVRVQPDSTPWLLDINDDLGPGYVPVEALQAITDWLAAP